MKTQLKIDIVSDVSCPWCIIGYSALAQALIALEQEVEATISWQPFELNPNMPSEGQDITEHIIQKYGISIEQANHNRDMIKQRGLAVGYEFGHRGGGRIYNTFDAHRLLHWARKQSKQTELKLALFDLYFKHEGNPSEHEALLALVTQIGLDCKPAHEVLASDLYAAEVRQQQQYYRNLGISSVPAVIINDKHLISGGQPSALFEQAIRQILTEK